MIASWRASSQAFHAEPVDDLELDVVPADGELADAGRRRDRHDAADLARALEGHLQGDHAAERPAHGESELADSERVEETPLRPGLVADGDAGKAPTVWLAGNRVARSRAAGAVAAAQQVHAHDAVLIGVEDLAGTDQRRPPVAGGVGRAGKGVDHQDLASLADRDAIVAIGDHQVGQHLAGLEGESPEPARDDLAGLRIGPCLRRSGYGGFLARR